MKLANSSFLPLASVILIALLGLLGGIDSVQQPTALFFIASLATVGLGVVGLGEWRIKMVLQGNNSALPNDLQILDREAGTVLQALQAFSAASGDYSESLAQAGQTLLSLASLENARAAVKLLVASNKRMQGETQDLSRKLETSRLQVAKLRSKLADAEDIGFRDALTTLANRRFFDAALGKEIAEARAQRTEMCLVFGDLDHFKKANDRFGHPFGDLVLKRFAEILTGNIKGRDLAARYGGEEFAIILPQTALASATSLVDKIRGALENQQWKNVETGQMFSKITASFGVVRLNEHDDAETLIKRADRMLYTAKNGGRNRVVSGE
jgi:diguanylate cyclase